MDYLIDQGRKATVGATRKFVLQDMGKCDFDLEAELEGIHTW